MLLREPSRLLIAGKKSASGGISSPHRLPALRTHEKTDLGPGRDRCTLREFQFPEYYDSDLRVNSLEAPSRADRVHQRPFSGSQRTESYTSHDGRGRDEDCSSPPAVG